jgi:hypothetical protein
LEETFNVNRLIVLSLTVLHICASETFDAIR